MIIWNSWGTIFLAIFVVGSVLFWLASKPLKKFIATSGAKNND